MFGEQVVVSSNSVESQEGLGSQVVPEFCGESVQKRSRKEEINWTEQREYVLVCTYKSNKAYIKIKGDKVNLDHKRLLAFHEVKDHPSFRDVAHLLTSGGLHQKFTRIVKEIISKYSLDGEGVSLTVLPENAPRVDAIVYKMIEEKIQNTKRASDKHTERFQDDILQSSVRGDPLKSTVVLASRVLGKSALKPQYQQQSHVNEEREQSPSAISAESNIGSATSVGTTSTSSERAEPKELSIMERIEVGPAQQSPTDRDHSLQKTWLALEERRLRIEEHRLTLEEQRIRVDTMNAENNRRLIELLSRRIAGDNP